MNLFKKLIFPFIAISSISISQGLSACEQVYENPNIIRTHAPIFGVVSEPCDYSSGESEGDLTLTLLPSQLPEGKIGNEYSFDFSTLVRWSNLKTGQNAPEIIWTSSNHLPGGLVLDSGTGIISGIPTEEGTTAFEIKATSTADGNSVYSITIKGDIYVSLSDHEMPIGYIGENYNFDFNSLVQWGNLPEGSTPEELEWQASATPNGLSLAANGILSGIPTDEVTEDYQISAWNEKYSTNNVYTITVENGDALKAIYITAKQGHACAVTPEKTIKCWGYNDKYQLGDRTNINRLTPVEVIGVNDAVSVHAGYSHTCAIIENGDVYCWGSNTYGQLGNTGGANGVPVKARINFPVKELSLGGSHTCALTTSAEVYCWGNNIYGQVGKIISVTEQSIYFPHRVDVSNVKKLEVGYNHNCLLTNSGAVKCWGYNINWELGNSKSTSSHYIPRDVVNLESGAIDVSAGISHNCAVKAQGTVVCWGYNKTGDLGRGAISDKEVATKDVVGISSGALKVYSGAYFSCSVLENNILRCWGNGGAGVFGNGQTGISNVSVESTGVKNFSQLKYGGAFGCGIFQSGTVKCWGQNNVGQLGDGTLIIKTAPVTTRK